MKGIKIICSAGCWACIVYAGIHYDLRVAALVILGMFLEAVIASVLIAESEKEIFAKVKKHCAGCELQRRMEDDGK